MRRLEHLDGVLSLIDREFGEMEQNGKFRNKEDVEILYKMMDIAKDAAEICEKQMLMEDGYSEYGYPVYGNSYYDGNSYARGRYAKRNSMGQYSRDGMGYSDGLTYRNGGRPSGYSMIDANTEYLDNLRGMLNDERTRDYVKRMIHEAE